MNSTSRIQTSFLAPMGVEILFPFCCLRVPQATKRKIECNKKQKDMSGTDSFMEN